MTVRRRDLSHAGPSQSGKHEFCALGLLEAGDEFADS